MNSSYTLLEKFLKNGMDIAQFKFHQIEDKINLFEMYREYLTGLNNGQRDINTLYDYDSNLLILIDDLEICTFKISHDYRTLSCETIYDLESPDLMFVLTAFFITFKELSTMIEELQKAFGRASGVASNIKADESKNAKFKPLPISVKNSLKKIKAIQKTIISDNKKFKTVRKDKE